METLSLDRMATGQPVEPHIAEVAEARDPQEVFNDIVSQLEDLDSNPELIDTLNATSLAKNTGMSESPKAKPGN